MSYVTYVTFNTECSYFNLEYDYFPKPNQVVLEPRPNQTTTL